jgi:hypothetical protein
MISPSPTEPTSHKASAIATLTKDLSIKLIHEIFAPELAPGVGFVMTHTPAIYTIRLKKSRWIIPQRCDVSRTP